MTLLKYEKPFKARESIDDEIATQTQVESYFVKNARVLELPKGKRSDPVKSFALSNPENVDWLVKHFSVERQGIPEVYYRTLLKMHRDNLDKKSEEKYAVKGQ